MPNYNFNTKHFDHIILYLYAYVQRIVRINVTKNDVIFYTTYIVYRFLYSDLLTKNFHSRNHPFIIIIQIYSRCCVLFYNIPT